MTAWCSPASFPASWPRPAIPPATGSGGSDLPDLKAEFSSEKHKRGHRSAARTANPNSANSQFYICFDDAPWLDKQYSVWGEVVEGMDNVDKIKKGGEHNNGTISGAPDKILKGADRNRSLIAQRPCARKRSAGRQARCHESGQIPALVKMRANAGAGRGIKIALHVADQEAGLFVHRPGGQKVQQHAGFRLAAAAGAAVGTGQAFGMMGAIFERIDMRPLRRQLGVHPVVQGVNIVFAVASPRHTGLVGHHEHEIADVIAKPHGLSGAREPFDLFGTVQIADIAVEHAVAIEEYGRTADLPRQILLCVVNILGHADIDAMAAASPRAAPGTAIPFLLVSD